MSFFNNISKLGKTKPKKGSSLSLSSTGSGKAEYQPLFLASQLGTTSLVKGNFRHIVVCPKYVDENDWLAVNIFDFFHLLNHFYGTISDFCTAKDCPIMSAGPGAEYQWVDVQKKSVKLPAPQYIDYAMTWLQNTLDDESVFPTKVGNEFPRDFQTTARQMIRQMFRVFAHIYHHHFATVVNLCEEAHLNSLFAHFVNFARNFDLLDRKEMAPLAELIAEMESVGLITPEARGGAR